MKWGCLNGEGVRDEREKKICVLVGKNPICLLDLAREGLYIGNCGRCKLVILFFIFFFNIYLRSEENSNDC